LSTAAWHSRPATSAQRWLLGKAGLWAAGPGLDAAYRRQLMELMRVRRVVASVATARKRLELRIGELERQADQTGRGITGQLAGLRRRYADAFRTGKDATRAAYKATAEDAQPG
jgi:hypothetical protein